MVVTRRGGGPGESSAAAAAATGIRLPLGCPELSSPPSLVVLRSRAGTALPICAVVAIERLPELDGLAAELAHLQHRQRDLLRQHDRLTERMLEFPNDFGLAWARSLAAEIEVMARRIAVLEAQLLPHRW